VTPISWSPQALRDLGSIRAYIAADSPAYAVLVVQRVVGAVERLASFPESGRIVPERNHPQIREIIVAPYRVVYRFEDRVVEEVTVFRGSRQFPGAV
jgi:toxin ParE1/3/4